jgi:hypothetical protein|tara:strand:- start:8540 stop:9382 length:843 start_codon:yes stop_codon:yes gene_type:complete
MALPKIYADTAGANGRTVNQGWIETQAGSGSLTFGTATGLFGSEITPFGASGQDQWSFVTTSNVSNPGRVNDNLDGAPAKFTALKNGVRYSLESAKECDFVAFYCTKADSNVTFYIYTSSSAGESYSQLTSGSITAGWNIISFSSTTKQYWVFQVESSTSSMDLELSEIILGKLVTFPHMWDLNGKYERFTKNKLMMSENGVEYAHKTGVSKQRWTLSMPIIDSTFKAELDGLYNNIDGSNKNFLFLDNNSDKYYVKMINKPTVGQIASNLYKADISLTE